MLPPSFRIRTHFSEHPDYPCTPTTRPSSLFAACCQLRARARACSQPVRGRARHNCLKSSAASLLLMPFPDLAHQERASASRVALVAAFSVALILLDNAFIAAAGVVALDEDAFKDHRHVHHTCSGHLKKRVFLSTGSTYRIAPFHLEDGPTCYLTRNLPVLALCPAGQRAGAIIHP